MMAKHVSYGIIGCGMMGQEHLRNIAMLPDASVAAIFEPDPAMRARSAALAPHARMTASAAEVAADPRVDCLLVASPNHLHFGQIKAAAAIRALPLLVEKPLFTDPADAGAVLSFARSYPAPAWVAMEYRYMPPVARFIERGGGRHRRHPHADHPRAPLPVSGESRKLEPLQPQFRRHLRGKVLPLLRSHAVHPEIRARQDRRLRWTGSEPP